MPTIRDGEVWSSGGSRLIARVTNVVFDFAPASEISFDVAEELDDYEMYYELRAGGHIVPFCLRDGRGPGRVVGILARP